ncbi:CopG family ribbon-helix-helix protein [Candidatus Bathyarchaeota archaeon]|nr:CopG family ribbon-helix-helix protein [Candidatus Bathyarchaeota archaeon]
MTVISASLTPELLDRLDEFVKKSGFSSRSEALRLAVRDSLSQFDHQSRQRGQVLSTVTIISETEREPSHLGLMNLRNGFDNIIFGNMHFHIEEGLCVEIFLVKGDAGVVMDFVSKAKTVRGVVEVNHTVTPLPR